MEKILFINASPNRDGNTVSCGKKPSMLTKMKLESLVVNTGDISEIRKN